MARQEGAARPVTSQQFQRLTDIVRRNSTTSLRDVALLQMSFRAGLRAMEIAALEIDTILDQNGEILRTIRLKKSGTKGAKGGIAYLSHPELREALRAYIVLDRSNKSTEYQNVFISRKGTPFSPSSMSRLFSHLFTRGGLDGYTCHSGRKGLARALNEQNVSVYNIQKILRHSNIQTTVNHYLSVDEDTLANLVEGV
jgi:integrase/recombinase XerD